MLISLLKRRAVTRTIWAHSFNLRIIVGAIAFALCIAQLPAQYWTAAAASTCELDGIDRIVAVGDVHGAYDRLVEILQTAGVVDARQRWAGQKTHLVQLGDVVDRGADSRKALDLLRRLQGEAEKAGGAVHLLLGNHEVMRMLGDLRFTTPGEYDAFLTPDSERTRAGVVETAKPPDRPRLLKETPLGSIEMRIAFGRAGDYGKWLRTLPVVVKINGILFLHGGISPAVATLNCGEINATVGKELGADLDKTRAAPLASLAAREDGPLWYRGLAQQPDTFATEVNGILAAQHARAIVIAHTVVPEGRILPRFGGRVIQMDTGMQPSYVPMGRASALEVRGGVVTAIYTDRRDTLPEIPSETPTSAVLPTPAPPR
jgi:hypothetical protein